MRKNFENIFRWICKNFTPVGLLVIIALEFVADIHMITLVNVLKIFGTSLVLNIANAAYRVQRAKTLKQRRKISKAWTNVTITTETVLDPEEDIKRMLGQK